MEYLTKGLMLSSAVTPALIFLGMAVGSLVHGRLKVEPSRPWTVFRERPVAFLAIVTTYLVIASLFAVAFVSVALDLTR